MRKMIVSHVLYGKKHLPCHDSNHIVVKGLQSDEIKQLSIDCRLLHSIDRWPYRAIAIDVDSFCLTDAVKADDVVMSWHVNQWTKLILKVLERFRLLSIVFKLERLDSYLPCGAIVECLFC